MKLLGVEIRRFWSRRLIRGLLLGVMGLMTVAGVIAFVQHSPEAPSPESIAERVNEELEMCRQHSADEWRAWDALGQESDYQGGLGEYLAEFESAEQWADEQCQSEFFGYYIEDPRYCLVNLWSEHVIYRRGCPDLAEAEVHTDEPYSVVVDGETLRTQDRGESGVIPSISITLLVVAVIAAASFVGGEYRAGTIETTLLWEPRRWRVLAAKLTAGALSAFLIHVLLLTYLVVVLLPAGLWRGTTAGVDGAFWQGIGLSIVRGGGAAALLAVLVMSIVFITRHTTGGVAVMLGYAAFSPSLVSTLLRPLRPRDVSENLFVFVSGGEVGRWMASRGHYESVVNHGTAMALLHVVVYAAIAVAVSGFIFRRRDID